MALLLGAGQYRKTNHAELDALQDSLRSWLI